MFTPAKSPHIPRPFGTSPSQFGTRNTGSVLTPELKSSIEQLVDARVESLIASGRILAAPVPPVVPKRRAPPKSFHFMKLPAELRLKIWEDTIEPRVVEIFVELSWPKGRASCTYTSRTPIPPLLHVHQESRQTGNKFYEIAFGTTRHEDRRYGGANTIWISFERDTPCFRPLKLSQGNIYIPMLGFDPSHLFYLSFIKGLGPNLKRIAVPLQCAVEDESSLVRLLSKLPNLRELILVGSKLKVDNIMGPASLGIVDGIKLQLIEPVNMAHPTWAHVVNGLEIKFREERTRDTKRRVAPQPTITAKILVRDEFRY